MQHSIDRVLLILTGLLVAMGFLIFSSASLGLLARDGASFSSVAFSQFAFGIVGGSIALFVASTIHYRVWRQYAFYVFLFAVVLTLLVFVDSIGFSHGGARRWLLIGSFSFQPAELLKVASVIYIATLLSGLRGRLQSFLRGAVPFAAVVGLLGIPLLLQPDTDTYFIIIIAALAMFITAGGRARDVAVMIVIGFCLVALLASARPYVKDRIMTFIDPSLDPQGAGYQIKQSLIAIGSGGWVGRGFGQSIQKFEYLPEPIGDSVFAVYAEESGFVGSVVLLSLFAALALRAYRVATHAPDLFGMLLVVGITTSIMTQIILNTASMLALFPLSGLPLPFVSHGGTALFVTLGSIGIILSVSKHQKQSAS